MPELARWNLKVSAQTDRDLRMHLAAKGGKKGDLSRYVEETVIRALDSEQFRRERLVDLEDMRRQLAQNPIPPMTESEVREEISAYRAERRNALGS
jgi:hypothetical protein